jgi:Ca2+-binding EF-hand superfamily protein
MDPANIRDAKLALAFKALNLSGSGQLSWADLEAIAQSTAQRLHCDAAGEQALNDAFQAWWSHLGAGADGTLDLNAFTVAISAGVDGDDSYYDQGIGKVVNALIQAADSNGDGIISQDEYLALYSGTVADSDAVLEGYRQLDLNDDGTVTVEEFQKRGREFYSAAGIEAAGSFLLGRPLA